MIGGGRKPVTVRVVVVLTEVEVKAPSEVPAARVRERASLGFPPPVGHAAPATS